MSLPENLSRVRPMSPEERETFEEELFSGKLGRRLEEANEKEVIHLRGIIRLVNELLADDNVESESGKDT